MSELRRAYGPFLSTLIVVLACFWILAMIVGPQAFMVEQSLWRMERSPEVTKIKMEIDKLYNDMDVDLYDLNNLKDSAATDADRQKVAELEKKISDSKTRIAELEKKEVPPVKVYTFENYTEMSGYHVQVFGKTILASLAVTVIAFLACYPIAYGAAKLATPGRAALILLALIIPYAINELLRVFAWLMILDYNGVLNRIIIWLGGEPVRFLDSGLGVFVAMVYAYVLFMVFPIYNTIETLDTNQIEAARDLGASTWKIHTRVVLPHAKPGIAVGSIMTFMLSAGSFSVPHIMTRGTAPPWFSQLIYSKFYDSFYWNQGAAYAFTLLIACVVFIFIMMKVFKVGIRDIAR